MNILKTLMHIITFSARNTLLSYFVSSTSGSITVFFKYTSLTKKENLCWFFLWLIVSLMSLWAVLYFLFHCPCILHNVLSFWDYIVIRTCSLLRRRLSSYCLLCFPFYSRIILWEVIENLWFWAIEQKLTKNGFYNKNSFPTE